MDVECVPQTVSNLHQETYNPNSEKATPVLRYPGGKQRQVLYFDHLLPDADSISGRYVEPFVGGGAIFFHTNPRVAVLSDKNPELIDLYIGIRDHPETVWELYRTFPDTKQGYYAVRDRSVDELTLPQRAARTLYLNRTCFKGMWRHNAQGKFNVGYGGQDRRWVISKERLFEVSLHLSRSTLCCSDFEPIIDSCSAGDFLFLDPPYRPGERDLLNDHYTFGTFRYDDQIRLAQALHRASERGVQWLMTNSSHEDITRLYEDCQCISLLKGTGKIPGHLAEHTEEVVIMNTETD
ncbi:DNA adenine methylase [Methanofollis ethanolicus]|jgi:DNA adenine methylase|uniref:DNA adenine methylase n=1 Tax=Methanofollis ethanolicus TaxID=488124 RepID=UPI0009F92B1E|nr:Dam family site-specific DNA-(adenine-N6)-methyltransferase [Methanofollis ethanolicus]